MGNLLIGADPEFFVKQGDKFVSAHGLVEGTKERPLPVEGGAVQVDGMALEFNINPAATFKEFDRNINTVIGEMHALVPNYDFVFEPVATFSGAYMRKVPEEAKKLGCTPDYNAWTGKVNEPPDGEVNFRTASGHIHLGWGNDFDVTDPEHIEACEMMVKQLDCVLGVSSVIWDTDTKRRSLYGNAGAYRPKSYGVEYRVMSNKWVVDHELRKYIFNASHYAYNALLNGDKFYESLPERYFRAAIDNSDLMAAWDYVNRHTYNIPGGNVVENKYQVWYELNKANISRKPSYSAAYTTYTQKKLKPKPVFNWGGVNPAAAIGQPQPFWMLDGAPLKAVVVDDPLNPQPEQPPAPVEAFWGHVEDELAKQNEFDDDFLDDIPG